MTSTTAVFILVGGFAVFAAAVWAAERVVLWWLAGSRPRTDVARDGGGHVRRLP